MNENQEIISNFIEGLNNKNIKLFSSALSEDCQWHTGQHFGTKIGKITCINHLAMVFDSLKDINFVSKQISPEENGVVVIEYAVPRKEKALGYLKPKDYFGVFILEIVNNKIQEIRTYYKDQTSRPHQAKPAPPKVSRTGRIENKDNDGYDPTTGLPT